MAIQLGRSICAKIAKLDKGKSVNEVISGDCRRLLGISVILLFLAQLIINHRTGTRMIIFNEQKNQLCNRLFAFLPSIAFALENDEKILILFFSEKYLSLFPGLTRHPLIKFSLSCKGVYPKGWRKALYLAAKGIGRMAVFGRRKFSFLDVSRNRNRLLFVRGWKDRYAPSYVAKHHEAIKTLFEPPIHVKAVVSSALSKREGTVIIGVHIRRGDYKTYKNGMYYHSDELYARYMGQLRALVSAQGKEACFLLCSNEPISETLTRNYSVISLPVNDHMVDLHALSRCDFLIGPPSTFSQWASFIGKVPLKFITGQETETLTLSDFNYIVSIDRFNNAD